MNKTRLRSEDQPCKTISSVTNPKFNILLTHHSYSSQTTLRCLGNNINNVISWNICLLSSKSYPTQPGGGEAYRYLHIYISIFVYLWMCMYISLSAKAVSELLPRLPQPPFIHADMNTATIFAPVPERIRGLFPTSFQIQVNMMYFAWGNSTSLVLLP